MTTPSSRSPIPARHGHARFAPIAAACGLLLLAGAAQAQQYTVLDIGVVGQTSTAYAINAQGAVAGSYGTLNAGTQSFVYRGGAVQYVGPAGTSSSATSINASGQVVSNDNSGHGYLYSNGSLTNLSNAPNSQGQQTLAAGINNAGQIAGQLGNSAALYTGGAWTPVGVLNGDDTSFATALNSSGAVAGYSFSAAAAVNHAFMYSGGTMTRLASLSSSGASVATAINDSGEVAGWSTPASGGADAVFWQGGAAHDLGTLGGTFSVAYGINGAGTVVGLSEIANYVDHAFITRAGVMTDLNSMVIGPSDFQYLGGAYAINNSGQIVGGGLTVNGDVHAFLLTPVGAVPEPASWAMALAGLGFIGTRLNRQRRVAR